MDICEQAHQVSPCLYIPNRNNNVYRWCTLSEAYDVFKEKIELALDELLERKPPPRPGGDIYVQHLRGKVRSESSIGISEIIKHLALAGYSMEDIIRFFHRIGIVSTENDVVRLRDAVRRVITHLMKEG